MNLPKKWLKNTIETFVKTDVEPIIYQYTFTLVRRYIGYFGLKEEELIKEKFCDSRCKSKTEIQNLACYQRVWKYKNAIDKAIGDSPDLRKQALDALASSSIFEKDKFISDWIENLDKK